MKRSDVVIAGIIAIVATILLGFLALILALGG